MVDTLVLGTSGATREGSSPFCDTIKMIKYSNNIQKAIDLASQLHADQKRVLTGVPYVSHLFGVAVILNQYTDDEDVVIAGLLHDVLEDVSPSIYNENDLLRDFNSRILTIVEDVSEKQFDNLTKQKVSWEKRKTDYLNHLATKSMPESVLVSMADKYNNWNSILNMLKIKGKLIWLYFNSDQVKQIWFMESYLQVLINLGYRNHPLFLELDELIKQIKTF